MIARLALVETKRSFTGVTVDIHRRLAQFEPDYVRLNPSMTVPTLVDGDRVMPDSLRILLFAFGKTMEDLDDATKPWVKNHYAFPIEELTFGWLLSWNPIVRRAVPKQLASAERRLRALAVEHPDLADAYRRRAEVFAARLRTFDPAGVAALFDDRRRAALGHLDTLDAALRDGRATLVPSGYGPADVVWTVFLARLHWARLGPEIARRPALARYTAGMFARPSFEEADVWRRIKILSMIRHVL
jgi:tetrachloro-p-hydroquinone reductive dehalogenase